jgi:hypothetical protein
MLVGVSFSNVAHLSGLPLGLTSFSALFFGENGEKSWQKMGVLG